MKTLIESLTTTVKTYAEGEVITRNLSGGQKILLIKSGAVFVEVGVITSESDKHVGFIKKSGSYIGLEEFVLRGKCNNYQVTSLYGVEVVAVSLADFTYAYEKLSTDRKLSVMAGISAQVSSGYCSQQIDLERIILVNTFERFKSCVKEIASEIGQPVTYGVRFKIKVSTLAKVCNTTEETTRRYLGKMMEANEIAKVDGRCLLLLR